MDSGFGILVVVAVLALIAFGAYYAYQQQVQRQADLAQLAARMGWQFDPSRDSSHDDRYGHFSIFTQGHSRFAYNTMHGRLEVAEQSWPVQLGDYHYKVTRSNGKSTTTQTYRFSYAILETPYLGAPDLFVRAEGFFDKLGAMLGFDDIDFESTEFSDRFKVKSSDKRFAYDVLHPRMMEFMLDGTPPTIELRRGQCCLYAATRCWSPEELTATVDWAAQFFALWPRHVTGSLPS